MIDAYIIRSQYDMGEAAQGFLRIVSVSGKHRRAYTFKYMECQSKNIRKVLKDHWSKSWKSIIPGYSFQI